MAESVRHNASAPHRLRGVGQRYRPVALVLLLGVLAGSGVLVAHGRYEVSHDIPNPFWATFNETYSYTPGGTSPNLTLFDVAPDTVVHQYLEDYIAVAGTYPCVSDPTQYDVPNANEPDPVISGQPCTIKRSVGSIAILEVTVTTETAGPLAGFPKATVRYEVRYPSSAALVGTITFWALRYQSYFRAWTHATCWRGGYLLFFYDSHPTFHPKGVDGQGVCGPRA